MTSSANTSSPYTPVRLRDVYRFAYGLALKSFGAGHTKDALRMLIEPCNYWRNVEVPAVLNELAVRPGERVLDVGSPKLPSLYLSYRTGAEIFATDLFPYFFDEYSHYLQRLGPPPIGAGYRMEAQDARALPYPDDHFDKVYAISVVEHIDDQGDSLAMREMARVLKPGGLCSLTVPFHHTYRESTIDHALYFKQPVDGKPVFYQRHYDSDALRARLVQPSGLALVRLDYFEERWLRYEYYYSLLNRFLRVPFSLLGPVFSRLFLVRRPDPPPRRAKAALLTLRKPLGASRG